jgi:multisubunit Na+/H+ antiporter MnhE subunit
MYGAVPTKMGLPLFFMINFDFQSFILGFFVAAIVVILMLI